MHRLRQRLVTLALIADVKDLEALFEKIAMRLCTVQSIDY